MKRIQTALAALATTVSAFSLLGIESDAGATARAVTFNTATSKPSTSEAATRAAARTRALFRGIGSKSPGCTIAVGRNGVVVFAEAFGSANLSTRARMTTDTIVDIGSTSKQFTATAIALLVDRKQLRLTDVVSDHLAGLPKWSDAVTIDQLIHHTSGIPDYVDLLTDEGFDDNDRATDADALGALADADQLDFRAGTKFEYSNSNYFLLGQIVQKVTGLGIGVFIKREIFAPLRLKAVMDASPNLSGKARSYAREGKRWVRADSEWLQLGDGGVQTTPSELVKWASQFWAPTVGGPGVNTVRWANAVDTDEEGWRYGFGLFETRIDGLGRVISHDGSWGGFSTAFAVLPARKLAVAATCTSADLDVEQIDIGTDVLGFWANVT